MKLKVFVELVTPGLIVCMSWVEKKNIHKSKILKSHPTHVAQVSFSLLFFFQINLSITHDQYYKHSVFAILKIQIKVSKSLQQQCKTEKMLRNL